MINELKPYLNFTQLIVAISFVCLLFCFNKKNYIQKLLFALLMLSFLIEISNFFLMVFKREDIVRINYSLFAVLFNCIWLILFDRIVQKRYHLKSIITAYLILGAINLFFYEGLDQFNHYNFIAGAFMYVFLFIYESFNQIKKENLAFFQTNNYLLLFSPILFMLGYSILISFNNRTLNATIVFAGMTLYDIIGYFINLIYYSLLITYCFREKNVNYV